jgi:hypothetical protein
MAYNNQKGDLKVQGHEGRHRARALLAEGYDTMPVRFLTSIRWSEQEDPSKFDYEKNWPSKVLSEDSDDISIPMPVSREQSMEPYSSEKLSLRSTKAAPTTPAFKRWFGSSTIVNPDGTPKVMYHGTGKDITSFERKTSRGSPIFLTDDPAVAASFSRDSQDYVLEQFVKNAPLELRTQKAAELLDKLKKDEFKGSEFKDRVKKLEQSLSEGKLNDIILLDEERYQRLFAGELATYGNVMPVYVKAENPFDYDNESHQEEIKQFYPKDEPSYELDDLSLKIRTGAW